VFDVNGDLEYILFPEGRILSNNGTFTFEYHLKDHLGSTRVVFEPSGTTTKVTQEIAYYPYGMVISDLSYLPLTSTNRYRREGKEYISDHGWNKYDYHWRAVCSMTGGRTLQIDPMAEKYPWISPYAFFNNNPLRYIDPTGEEWRDAQGNVIEDHSNIQAYIFFDPKSFTLQTIDMYKDLVAKYGEGSVAVSGVTTVEEFVQDWGDMASGNIQEVNLNYHGGPQTINLDSNEKNPQYITATGSTSTPLGNPAKRVEDLPTPSGNISNAQLNINSCRSNKTDADLKGTGQTLAQSFRENTSFNAIRTTAQGVSYHFWFSPTKPHPQNHSPWQFLYRPKK
jgi:RHS repeat-associated protein